MLNQGAATVKSIQITDRDVRILWQIKTTGYGVVQIPQPSYDYRNESGAN